MTDWENARDSAATQEQQSADRWQRKQDPESLPFYSYGVEVGFKRGADFGREWESKRAEAEIADLKSVIEGLEETAAKNSEYLDGWKKSFHLELAARKHADDAVVQERTRAEHLKTRVEGLILSLQKHGQSIDVQFHIDWLRKGLAAYQGET